MSSTYQWQTAFNLDKLRGLKLSRLNAVEVLQAEPLASVNTLMVIRVRLGVLQEATALQPIGRLASAIAHLHNSGIAGLTCRYMGHTDLIFFSVFASVS